MRERPILFQGAMVRAILDGSKTQTRRVMKPQPLGGAPEMLQHLLEHGHQRWATDEEEEEQVWKCPYGQPGDRLWVRETWGVGSRPDPWGGYDGIEYRADQAWLEEGDDLPCHKVQTPDDVCLGDYRSGWRPSIHMPRWACRITLEITDVRVERLQDISEADAIAEGVKNSLHLPGGRFATENYAHLWWTINGDGSWEANPWVWVVEFRRLP